MLTKTKSISSLPELVMPLSKDKVYLLLELIDSDACDAFTNCMSMAQALDIDIASPNNMLDELSSNRYITVEREISEANRDWAERALAVFCQDHFNGVLRAYLMIDGNLVGYN